MVERLPAEDLSDYERWLAEVYISPGSVELIFEPLAKDWVERVIENEGKA